MVRVGPGHGGAVPIRRRRRIPRRRPVRGRRDAHVPPRRLEPRQGASARSIDGVMIAGSRLCMTSWVLVAQDGLRSQDGDRSSTRSASRIRWATSSSSRSCSTWSCARQRRSTTPSCFPWLIGDGFVAMAFSDSVVRVPDGQRARTATGNARSTSAGSSATLHPDRRRRSAAHAAESAGAERTSPTGRRNAPALRGRRGVRSRPSSIALGRGRMRATRSSSWLRTAHDHRARASGRC